MYVILSSKPGVYHVEFNQQVECVESYAYQIDQQLKTWFHLVRVNAPDQKVRIVEDEPPHVVNSVPVKFLDSFPSIDAARAALTELARFGSLNISLERRDA